jgi:chromosome partitioning protein
MKVVALLAWKGGVGKSTLTINLAAAAIEEGHKVGIIDLDPQSSLSEWSDRREAEQPFVSDAKPRAVAQIVEAGRGIGLDLMLIDTPPNATDEVEAALAVADAVAIPTGVALFDLKAVTRTVRAATQASKPTSVVLNRVGNRSDREAARIRRELNQIGMPILRDVIHDLKIFPRSADAGMTVIESEPEGKAAADVRAVWKMISKQVGLRAKTRTRKLESGAV